MGQMIGVAVMANFQRIVRRQFMSMILAARLALS